MTEQDGAKDHFNAMWDSANFGEDGADADELDAALNGHHEGPHDGEHHEGPNHDIEVPTGEEIIDWCDQDDDERLSKREAWECIRDFIPETERQMVKEHFNREWDNANFGEDGADAAELEAALNSMEEESDDEWEEGPNVTGDATGTATGGAATATGLALLRRV